jgi:hypothetical protein
VRWPDFRWPRRCEARLVSPARSTNLKALELQTAKVILAEIFRAQPGGHRGHDSKATGGEDLA